MITTAPGKLFVMGEYAVLAGAPAILMPTPQCARVDITRDGKETLTMVGASKDTLPLADGLKRSPLLAAVVNTLDCRPAFNGKSLLLNTADFFRAGVKLGLGSSAALTTALVKAIAPRATQAEIIRDASQCHRAFQGGRGSGADIALATVGRPIIFTAGRPPVTISPPAGLYMLAIWTGKAASTSDYINRLAAWRQDNAAAYDATMTQMQTCVENFIQQLDKPASDLLALLTQYDRLLEQLSRDSGLNFYNQAHLTLRKRVESARCAYKPSGAGGGDFGIACSADKEALMTLAAELKQAGRLILPVNGVTR